MVNDGRTDDGTLLLLSSRDTEGNGGTILNRLVHLKLAGSPVSKNWPVLPVFFQSDCMNGL